MVYTLPSPPPPCTSGMKVGNSPDWKSIITATKFDGIFPSCSLKILPHLPKFTWHQNTQKQKQCNAQELEYQKSRIWQTPSLSASSDSNTNNMKFRLFTLFFTFGHFLSFFLHFFFFFSGTSLIKKKSYVTCDMSHVTCHMALTPTAKDLPLLNPQQSTVDWFEIKKVLNKS